MADNAIGLIETRGLVPLMAGIEAMLKTADVQCVALERVGSGMLTAAVQGSIAAVRQAVEAGARTARQHGEVRGAQIYPKPHPASSALLENGTRELLAGDSRPGIPAPSDAPASRDG